MFTTSRYASENSKLLAQILSKNFNSFYVSRGKKSISQLSFLARNVGETRIVLIKENKDHMPVFLEIISIDELGKWEYIEEKIGFSYE